LNSVIPTPGNSEDEVEGKENIKHKNEKTWKDPLLHPPGAKHQKTGPRQENEKTHGFQKSLKHSRTIPGTGGADNIAGRCYPCRMSIKQLITLNNGVEMPVFGLGVFKAESGEETANAVTWALQAGYTAVDTAAFYENEGSVGQGIRDSGIPRGDVFVTTKVWNSDQGYDTTLRAFDRSMAELQMEYLDLYLVHWPIKGKYKETWKALEKLYREERVRAIGVSNFEPHHLDDLLSDAEVPPAVNQVELHPYLQQKAVRDACSRHNIAVTAWSPIARGKILHDETLAAIAGAHGKTNVQVTLRWELQHGIITIPKSVRKERIEENFRVFDFALSDDEMARIDALDLGNEGRIGPHPDTIS
jgi:methylglyoxal/glyoxal reductase